MWMYTYICSFLAEALRLFYGERELLHQLLVALVGRQIQPVETAKGVSTGHFKSTVQYESHNSTP